MTVAENIAMVAARTTGASGAASVIDLLRMFWRQKGLLLAVIMVLTAVSVLVAYQITPRYTSVARILMMSEPATAGSLRDPMATARAVLGSGGDRAAIYSEIEVMRSDRLLEYVVAELDLHDDREFNPALQPGLLGPLRHFGPIEWLIRTLSPLQPPQTDAQRKAREMKRIVDSLRSRMNIRPPGLATMVSIEFETTSAQKSARLANVFVDVYMRDYVRRQARNEADMRIWLDTRIAELRTEVQKTEEALADFLAERRLDEDGGSPIIERQIVEAGRLLSAARTEASEKEVRLRRLRQLMAREGGLETAREVQASQAILRLRADEARLVARAAELESRFGEKHPTMINLRAEIRNTRAQIDDEQRRIVEEVANEARVATARVASLERELKELDAKRAATNDDRVKLLQLKREAIANRKLYEAYLARSKEAEQTASLSKAPIEVISPAKVPTHPSYPRRGLIAGFGFLMSIGMGVFLILLMERLHGRFRTPAQVERVTHEQTIGVVPRLSGAERRGGAVHDLIFSQSRSRYVEAIRSLRTSLLVGNGDNPPKVVMIASAEAEDGKTSLALSLARLSAIASMEGKVMLIDGDLRNSSVAQRLGMKPEKGLMHLFSREASLADVVLTDPRTGLHVLPAIPGTPNPPELLNSHHMRDLLADLRRTYDMIIIDSPALGAVSDARVLAHYADTTVFVVRWESTKQHNALESLRQLATAGARIAGVVMQQVNVRKTESYGYREAAA